MKSAWLLAIVALSLACACSKRAPEEVKSDLDQPIQFPPSEEPPIKAATPEDPGRIATVIVPLEILKQQARQTPYATQPKERLPIDHPVHSEAQDPQNIVPNVVFLLRHYSQVSFAIPPHQGNARLRGTFRSFTKRSDPDSSSDRTAAIDLMLLNEEEYNQLLHGQPQSVTYELGSANNQRIDWRVPTTYADSQTYHLVFGNSPGGKIKYVEADFSISFE